MKGVVIKWKTRISVTLESTSGALLTDSYVLLLRSSGVYFSMEEI